MKNVELKIGGSGRERERGRCGDWRGLISEMGDGHHWSMVGTQALADALS